MADTASMPPADISDAATKPAEEAAAPVYVHKLSDHQVQGDATFKEINDHDRPYEGGVEKAQNLPDLRDLAAFVEDEPGEGRSSIVGQSPAEVAVQVTQRNLAIDDKRPARLALDATEAKKADRREGASSHEIVVGTITRVGPDGIRVRWRNHHR